jgi:hypothetical protein
MALPSGATMRFRPPRRWNRIGIRTTNVVPSSFVSTPRVMQLSFRPAGARRRGSRPLGPDPHLDGVLARVDPLDEQLYDPSLLCQEQVATDAGEIRERARDVAIGDHVARFASLLRTNSSPV